MGVSQQDLAELEMHSLAGCSDAVDTAIVSAERALKDRNYAEAIEQLDIAKQYAQKVLIRSGLMAETIGRINAAITKATT